MQALRRGWIVALGLAAALVLAGCGGGGGAGSAESEPAAAVVGPGGGVVQGADGARVDIPPEAFAEPVTVRITKDSVGAPALPEALVAAGPVYAITPHGGGFRRHVAVTIPLPATPPADNEQQVLVTAEPGDTRWRVLSGAQPVGGALRVPVMQFSYFQIVTLRDLRAPTLVLVMDRVASVPVPGTTQISADYEFAYAHQSPDQPRFNTEARLTHAPPLLRRSGATTPAPTYCQPAVLGPAGVRLTMSRDGSEIAPGLAHHPTLAAAASQWPRNRAEAAPQGFIDTALVPVWSPRSGAGVAHFWGQDQPRAGAWVDVSSSSAVPARPDRYTLPPTGNAGVDDEWTWYGSFALDAAHNGRLRIDATVATDCGFDVAAVPLAFRLNVTGMPGSSWRLVEPADSDQTVHAGENVELVFHNLDPSNVWDLPEENQEYLKEVTSLSWETSSDGRNWRSAPELAPSVTVDTRYRDPNPFVEGSAYRDHAVLRLWRMRFNGAMPGLSGWYRAYACIRVLRDDPSVAGPARTTWLERCGAGSAVRLNVVLEPPTVTRQPVGQTVIVGETASLSVAVQGTPSADLQWQKRTFADAFLQRPWSNIAGATAATYTTPPLTLADHPTLYRVAYSNASGGGFSDVAMVSVVAQLAPPTISAQPGSLNVTVGGTAVFAVTADGAAPLSYQWRRNGVAIAGANAPILTLANVTAVNDGRYELVVTNRAGSITSEPAALVVTLGTPVALPPTIAQSPASLAVPAGSAANFAVAVTGTGPYSYVWTRAGEAQPVGSEPVLAFASVQPGDAGRYRVRVTNNVGTVLSAEADLTVGPASGAPVAPAIATPPVAAAATPGTQAVFAVGATGSAPLTFQWRRNGLDIPGANAAVLVLPAVSGNDAGQYSIEVRNSAGVALSTPVPLVVIGAPTITTQPVAASATEGASASFGVTATGEALRYQWMRNGVAIVGATAASYATPPLALADNGATYAVIVYNGAGLVFSVPAVLTVNPAVIAPTVTLQPSDLTVNEGTPAGIEFSFGGTAPFTTQLERLVGGAWTVIAGPGPLADNAVWRSYTGNLALADSGSVYRVVASNAAGTATTRAATVTVVPAPITTVQGDRFAAGWRHTCAVLADGNAACWGYNGSGQLGAGNVNSSPTPRNWALPESASRVAAGSGGSCVLTVSGRLLCSGNAVPGTSTVPVEITSLANVRQVVLGSGHTCALLAERTVWCWGNNASHQLGDGSGVSSSTPRQVQRTGGGALTNVAAITAGDSFNCALLTDGTVVCWGQNSTAQTGQPASAATPRATAVAGLAGVTRVAAGAGHACALAAGSIACWGDNSAAQFGIGSTTPVASPTATPTAVPGLSGVTSLASGSRHVCALMGDTTVRCWGTASMGNGSGSEVRLSTVAVAGLGAVVGLSAGLEHTCAQRGNGALVCWGASGEGQLGLGDTFPRTTPTQVPGLTVLAP